jgi:hypothetical protein
MWSVRSVVAALLIAGLAGCDGQPELLCEGVRIVWGFEEADFDSSDDVSDEPGIQVDIVIRTSLLPGTLVSMVIADEDDNLTATPPPVFTDNEGDLLFEAVPLPLGQATLVISAFNGCRDVDSTRVRTVWPTTARPRCEMSLSVQPRQVPFFAPLEVYNQDDDADPIADGLQLDAVIDTGIPESAIIVYVRDVATATDQPVELTSDSGGLVTARLTFGEGEQAVRSVCTAPTGQRNSTTTRRFWSDVSAPVCSFLLPAPGTILSQGDDLDSVPQNGIQFIVRGLAAGGDVEGEVAAFEVDSVLFPAPALDANGETEVEATIADAASQARTFTAFDHAGNSCSVTDSP